MERRWPCIQNKPVIRRGCVDLSYNIEDVMRCFKRTPFSGRHDDSQNQGISPFGSMLGSDFDELNKEIVKFVDVAQQFDVTILHLNVRSIKKHFETFLFSSAEFKRICEPQ